MSMVWVMKPRVQCDTVTGDGATKREHLLFLRLKMKEGFVYVESEFCSYSEHMVGYR